MSDNEQERLNSAYLDTLERDITNPDIRKAFLELRAELTALRARIDSAPEYWAIKHGDDYFAELFLTEKHAKQWAEGDPVVRVRLLESEPPTPEPEEK